MGSDLGRGIVAAGRLLHTIMESYHQIVKGEVQLMILYNDCHAAISLIKLKLM